MQIGVYIVQSFKGLINKSLKSAWQSTWDAAVINKLHSVKPVLGEWLPFFRTNRREKVVLARLEQAILAIPFLCRKTPFIHCLVLVFWWVCHCPPLSICQLCLLQHREKVFPFYYICVHTFSCFFSAVVLYWTGTLLIDQLSYYFRVENQNHFVSLKT